MSSNRSLLVIVVVLAVVVAIVAGLLVYLRPATVPDVITMKVTDATSAVESAGLQIRATGRIATGTVAPGAVVLQSPPGGTSVPSHSSVDVTVAVAPSPVALPAVTGLTADAAVKALSDALFLPRRVDVFGTTATPGVVVDQAPAAGVKWMTGEPVAIAVASTGATSGVQVPDFTGKSLQHASSELADRGLVPFAIVVDLNEPQANTVTDQLPAGGARVAPGTTVVLLLKLTAVDQGAF